LRAAFAALPNKKAVLSGFGKSFFFCDKVGSRLWRIRECGTVAMASLAMSGHLCPLAATSAQQHGACQAPYDKNDIISPFHIKYNGERKKIFSTGADFDEERNELVAGSNSKGL
jgi:hypothetical protein